VTVSDRSDASGTPELSTDAIYESLGNRRRRYAIHYLKQCDDPVSVRELAEQVAAWENDKPVAELTSQERKRVYIAFYQSHLSTMDGEGLVEYDPDAGVVELSGALTEADIYLEIVPKEDIPWNQFYVGLAAANALLLALVWFDVPPFGAVPGVVSGGIVLVSFAVSAFVQTYYTGRMRFGDAGSPPQVGERE